MSCSKGLKGPQLGGAEVWGGRAVKADWQQQQFSTLVSFWVLLRILCADRISQIFWGRTSAKNCGTAPTPFTGHPKARRKSTPIRFSNQLVRNAATTGPPHHLESPQLRPPNPLSISAVATFTHRPTTLQGHTTFLLRPSQANLRPLQHQDKSSSSWLGSPTLPS